MTNRSSIARIALLATVLVALIAVIVFRAHRAVLGGRSRPAVTNVTSHDVGSQMIDCLQRGQYDEAVQVGMKALRHQPGDELILQEIATVYLVRAQKEPQQKEQWLTRAVLYTDQALSLNSKNRDAAGVQLFQHARTYELVGDLSTTERCTRYTQAQKLLEERIPLLQGDNLTLEGRTFPLAPLRKENDTTVAAVKEKAAKAGCG